MAKQAARPAAQGSGADTGPDTVYVDPEEGKRLLAAWLDQGQPSEPEGQD